MQSASELIHKGFESKDLDYKGPIMWNEADNRRVCCGIVKDVLAMANTKGGYIIIGVEEKSRGNIYS